ncbi:hypothetical protein AZA_37190 [Nitrospirillum viridazoti Y2]|nr:hypothetical protein AZA_37190 [Nitrospirillum amazonense Y2]
MPRGWEGGRNTRHQGQQAQAKPPGAPGGRGQGQGQRRVKQQQGRQCASHDSTARVRKPRPNRAMAPPNPRVTRIPPGRLFKWPMATPARCSRPVARTKPALYPAGSAADGSSRPWA